MKCVLLCGGLGTRLYPTTKVLNKHVIPVFDKPMVYYPLTTLMLGGIRDFLVVSSRMGRPLIEDLLGDGSQFGISIQYIEQSTASGIADCVQLARDFINGEDFILALGDNIFFGAGLAGVMSLFTAGDLAGEVGVVTVSVDKPQNFGVINFAADGSVESFEEKPAKPKGSRIVAGLYRLPASAPEKAKNLTKSLRGELEITDLLNAYVEERTRVSVFEMPRGVVWFDAGTTRDLFLASEFVKSFEAASGSRIGCPEEVALRSGWVSESEVFAEVSNAVIDTDYFKYIRRVSENLQRGIK